MTAPQIMTTGAVVSAQGAFSTAHGPMTKAAASVMTMPSSMFMSWMPAARPADENYSMTPARALAKPRTAVMRTR